MMKQQQQQEAAVVISPQFCSHLPTTLAISEKSSIFSNDKYIIRDVNGNLVFKVVGFRFSLHSRRLIILDAAGRPIATLLNKNFTLQSRWKVFRGESSDPKDLIFSAKESSYFQLKTKLHVFLANNISEKVCDYAIKAQSRRSENSCLIYAGDSDSSTIIAQMKEIMKGSFQRTLLGKPKFLVDINPNVDYAFIASLIIIFEEIKSRSWAVTLELSIDL